MLYAYDHSMTAPERPTSPLRELASHIIEKPVNAWLIEQADHGLSTREIATALDLLTGGKVSVSHATIAVWLTDAGLTDVARRTNQYE